MKRSALKCWLRELTGEYENKPHEYWDKVSFPICFERTYAGRSIQVTIHILESTPEYLHIGFSADAGGLSAYFPVGTDIIVNKK